MQLSWLKALITRRREQVQRKAGECPVCGGTTFSRHQVLWPGLISEWELAPEEADYIDEQQGMECLTCKASLRGMTLAHAIVEHAQFPGRFEAFCRLSGPARKWHVLEINEAAQLTAHLARLPGHVFAKYPEVDMQALPYADNRFDCVLHSDTLEHVPNPVLGLRECWRVLKPGGFLAYTIPIIVGRSSRRRDGLTASYHGAPTEAAGDFRVITEYGADFWKETMSAGFRELSLYSLNYPASLAIVAAKNGTKRLGDEG